METYAYMIKPASSLCNLNCSYCFYNDVSNQRVKASMGIMDQTTMEVTIDQMLDKAKQSRISIAFQGGEPTLAGLAYFQSFCSYVEKTNTHKHIVDYSIQTNGVGLGKEWMDFFSKHDFLVGLSVDGHQSNHDRNRLSKKGNITHKEVMETYQNLLASKVEVNVLTVLTESLSYEPEKLYRFYKEVGIKYIQLIPCLDSLEGNANPQALSPKGFARFYKAFFDLWYQDMKKDIYMSVGLFEDLIPMLVGISPLQCGMLGTCSVQNIVEGDGSVYPCDFYVLDQFKMGHVKEKSFTEMRQNPVVKSFLGQQKKTCKECSNCRFARMCHGNCKRLSTTLFDETYCGYKVFLDYAMPRMQELARLKLASPSIC